MVGSSHDVALRPCGAVLQHAVNFTDRGYRLSASAVPRELQIPAFWGEPHDESDEECKPLYEIKT